jgi:DNA-binding Lrp family transcriptional regulator
MKKINFLQSVVFPIINEYNLKNPTQFCLLINLNPSNIGSWNKGCLPSVDTIGRIIEKFPEVSPEWLITGEGEMHRTIIGKDSKQLFEYIKEQYERELSENKQLQVDCMLKDKIIEQQNQRINFLEQQISI